MGELFTPAPGTGSAQLLGVDAAKASFERAFARATGAEGASTSVLVTGTVGSGKTSLLRWAAGRADELGWATLFISVHSGIRERMLDDELPRLLIDCAGPMRMSRLSARAAEVLNFSGHASDGETASIYEQIRVLSDVLVEQQRGLFLALDEAHRDAGEGYDELLAEIDRAVAEVPNLVVGIGAMPEFTERIFRDRVLRPRTSEDFVKLGRLAHVDAVQLLERGFAAAGLKVNASSVELLARFSAGYAPMLQSMGSVLAESVSGEVPTPSELNQAVAFGYRIVHRLYYVRLMRELPAADLRLLRELADAGVRVSGDGAAVLSAAPLSLIALADGMRESADVVRAQLTRLVTHGVLVLNEADQAEVALPMLRESFVSESSQDAAPVRQINEGRRS